MGLTDHKTLILSKRPFLQNFHDRQTFFKQIFKTWAHYITYLITLQNQTSKESSCGIIQRFWWFWNLSAGKTGRAGIKYINDLLHPTEPRFLSHDELSQTYGVNASFLQVLQIRSAIPYTLRTKLNSPASTEMQVNPVIKTSNDLPAELLKLTSRKIYGLMIKAKKPSVSSQRKWNMMFPVAEETAHDYWKEIYRMPYRTAREMKLQAFQFCVIQRILPCNKFLYNITIRQTDTCSFCQSSDNIEHFLYHCPKTKSFWDSECRWMDREADIQIAFSVRAEGEGCQLLTPFYKILHIQTEDRSSSAWVVSPWSSSCGSWGFACRLKNTLQPWRTRKTDCTSGRDYMRLSDNRPTRQFLTAIVIL